MLCSRYIALTSAFPKLFYERFFRPKSLTTDVRKYYFCDTEKRTLYEYLSSMHTGDFSTDSPNCCTLLILEEGGGALFST